MKIKLTDPTTGAKYYEYKTLPNKDLIKKLDLSHKIFKIWHKTSFKKRSRLLHNVIKILHQDREKYAGLISLEMGKNIEDALAEVDKCKTVCEYYAINAEAILKDNLIQTGAKKTFVRHEALGIIFAIMPWNFPFWQVFRFAAPALMAGNTALLKHASNVPRCSQAIQEIFEKAGYPSGVFQSLLITPVESELVIKDDRVRAITLTGSEIAGSKVASLASKYLKKSILELGGSDPFIVFEDADIDSAVKAAATSRMLVSGQSCIAAKRFIIHKNIIKEFTDKFKKELENVKYAPLISLDSLNQLNKQVKDSIKMGAKIILGGQKDNRKGFYYKPTILTNISFKMPVWNQETFGPVAPIIEFDSIDNAIKIANDSRFGLGSSIWTKNKNTINSCINNLEAGSVFVNSIVKSDARLPFGGTKLSGYGRELSENGIKEFVNIKTIWIN